MLMVIRAINLGEFDNGKAQQPLPRAFADHEADLDKFQKYCHSMMQKILTLFAIGLEVTPSPKYLIRVLLTSS